MKLNRKVLSYAVSWGKKSVIEAVFISTLLNNLFFVISTMSVSEVSTLKDLPT